MNRLKLTGLFSFLIATTFLIISCEQDNDSNPRYNYLNRTLSNTQVVTPTTASSRGTIEGTYDRETHTLTYRVKLSGFPGKTAATGAPTAIHLHAFADSGYNPIPTTQFATTIAQAFTTGWVLTDSTEVTPPTTPKTYTYGYTFNGTMFVDNYLVRDEDLLAGKYYIDVHTTFPVYPGGTAIRGQLKFN
jgi:hypothetical protein